MLVTWFSSTSNRKSNSFHIVEMHKALAFLEKRLRAGTDENRRALSEIHNEMDAGAKVR